ncbi:MAG: erythromycin esterase family protein, partial [Euryarchaeota archaeon]|nr:erythromycin esterase family protein [Euryarchaeota archaeon]
LQSARIVLQIEDEFLGAGPTMREAMRDKYMAENVEWILEQAGPDAKIVLWAHNGHIQEGWVQYPNTMCTYLREKYGNEMVTFGFTFYKGSFNACDWDRREQIIEDLKSGYLPIKVYHFEKPLEYNYGYYFHSAGFPYFFLDLRDVRYTKTTYWLFCCTHRGAGAVFSESWPRGSGNIMSLAECFDVTIYIQEMTPSQLLER